MVSPLMFAFFLFLVIAFLFAVSRSARNSTMTTAADLRDEDRSSDVTAEEAFYQDEQS